MEVLLLTIFCSLLLASLFTFLFLVERKRRKRTGVEQTALLPLAEEGRRRADGEDDSTPFPDPDDRNDTR